MCALYVVADREKAEKLTRGDRVCNGSSEYYSAIDDERFIGGDGSETEDGNGVNNGLGRSETDRIRV